MSEQRKEEIGLQIDTRPHDSVNAPSPYFTTSSALSDFLLFDAGEALCSSWLHVDLMCLL